MSMRGALSLSLLSGCAWGLRTFTAPEVSGEASGEGWLGSSESVNGWLGSSETNSDGWLGSSETEPIVDSEQFEGDTFHRIHGEDPRRKIAKDSSPFYMVREVDRHPELVYPAFRSHPVLLRYFARNHLMAVVPEKAVQQAMLESILPEISPYGKIGLLKIDVPEDYSETNADKMRFHRWSAENQTSKVSNSQAMVENVKNHLKDLQPHFECVVNFYKQLQKKQVSMAPNFFHPYLGTQLWVSVNTDKPEVRKTVLDHVNGLFEDILPGGFRDMDALPLAVYQYMPVLMDVQLMISKSHDGLDFGDVGKNIIIGNQHFALSGYVSYDSDPNVEEDQRCEVDRWNIAERIKVFSSGVGSEKVANGRLRSVWSPTGMRFQLILSELRKKDGKVRVEEAKKVLQYPEVNEACRITANARSGKGKTWERRCMLGEKAVQFLQQQVIKSDADFDGELSFDEYLTALDEVARVFNSEAVEEATNKKWYSGITSVFSKALRWFK